MAERVSPRALILPCALLIGLAQGRGIDNAHGQSSASDLQHSAHVWEAHDRGDLARLALEKWVTTRSSSPDALLELGELHLRMAAIDDARRILTQLRSRWPKSAATRAFEIEFRLATSARLQLASIQRRMELGQGVQARAELDQLLPGGAPGGIFDLEYYRLLAAMPGGAAVAERQLRELAARHADDSRYPLALARELIRHEETRVDGARRLNELAGREDVRIQEVDDLLSRALIAAGVERVPADIVRAYLKRHPTDQRVAAAFAKRSHASVQRRVLENRSLGSVEPQLQRENLSAMREALRASAGIRAGADSPANVRPSDSATRSLREAIAMADWLNGAQSPAMSGRWDGGDAPAGAEPSAVAHGERHRMLIAAQWALRARQSVKARDLQLAATQTSAAIVLNARRFEDAIEVAERLDILQRPEECEELLATASRLQPGSTWLFETHVRWLMNHQRSGDALALLDTHAIDTRWTPDRRDALRAAALDQRSQQEIAAGNDSAAMADLELSIQWAPLNPWPRYRLAELRGRHGQPDQGRALLDEGVRQAPTSDEMRYARALYLASLDVIDAAYEDMSHIPPERRTESMGQFVERLSLSRARALVRRLQDSGNVPAARERLEALLNERPNDRDLRIMQADFERGAGNPKRARDLYAPLVSERPEDFDTRLSYARTLIETGDTNLARLQVQTIEQSMPATDPSLPDVWMLAGNIDLGQRRFAHAREYFKRAAQSDDTGAAPWARSALERIDARRRSSLELAVEALNKPGDPGISQYDSVTVPMVWSYGYDYERRFVVHADAISIDAGALPTAFDESALLGTLQASGPAALRRFTTGRESGLSLGIGYRTDRVAADIGTTPLGFLLPRVIGSVVWTPTWGPVDVDIGLARRAVKSSVLSFAGLRDPVTGRKWGAVVETGPYVSAGMYRERYSFSGSLRRSVLTGQNVLDNDFLGARVAASRRLWSGTHERVSVGLELNHWSYSHNMQHYTFGSGGYYSPQSYHSIRLPVELQGSRAGWSYQLRAALSRTSSARDGIDFYPSDPTLQAAALAAALPPGFDAPLFGQEHGSSLSASAYAAIERRLGQGWVGGVKLDLDRSDYYEPTTLAFYVRYALGESRAEIEIPPRPVRKYIE